MVFYWISSDLAFLPGVVTNSAKIIPKFRMIQWVQMWFLGEVQERRVFGPGPDVKIKPDHLISGDVSVEWDLFKVGTRIGNLAQKESKIGFSSK